MIVYDLPPVRQLVCAYRAHCTIVVCSAHCVLLFVGLTMCFLFVGLTMWLLFVGLTMWLFYLGLTMWLLFVVGPPTRPVHQLKVNYVDQQMVNLTWNPPPPELGGRQDLRYRVECPKCGSHVSYIPGDKGLNTTTWVTHWLTDWLTDWLNDWLID